MDVTHYIMDYPAAGMDYRLRLAVRMLSNKKGSMAAAVLAVSVGILVMHVNFVIFQGLFDAFVRDMRDYRFGDIYVTDEEDYITKADTALVGWFERTPYVMAATPRMSASVSVNATSAEGRMEEHGVPVVGIDPATDRRASGIHRTISEGEYVTSRNSMVLGSIVARDLGIGVGDSVRIKITDRWGQDQFMRFPVSGISGTAGGQGLDTSMIMHIDTLRDLMSREGHTNSLLVKMYEPERSADVRDLFLESFPGDDFVAETIEESAEESLRGFRSGIAMINMIGMFGMMSSAFAIVTIQMMLVTSKTREIGIMRAIGARRRDILVLFVLQGLVIGAVGAGCGTAAGLAYTAYAKETKMSFDGSIELEVTYNWNNIARTGLMALGLAVVASVYPAYRATKLQPVEAMRAV